MNTNVTNVMTGSCGNGKKNDYCFTINNPPALRTAESGKCCVCCVSGGNWRSFDGTYPRLCAVCFWYDVVSSSYEDWQNCTWKWWGAHLGSFRLLQEDAGELLVLGSRCASRPTWTRARSDIVAFKDAVMSGKRKRELVNLFPSECARYQKFIAFAQDCSFEPTFKWRSVYLHVGATGLGKTRWVYDNEPEFWEMPISNGTNWYDAYDQDEVVLLDEFSGSSSHVSLVTLLKLLDGYVVRVPIKGSFVAFAFSTLYHDEHLARQMVQVWRKRRTISCFSQTFLCGETFYWGGDNRIWYPTKYRNTADGSSCGFFNRYAYK